MQHLDFPGWALPRPRIRGKLHLLLLTLLFAFVGTQSLEASHFRYGSLSWRHIDGNTVEFKIQQAGRISFFYGAPPSVGDVSPNLDVLYFGDGNSASITLDITAVNAADDWFYGETTITHTYATAGDFIAFSPTAAVFSVLRMRVAVDRGTYNLGST